MPHVQTVRQYHQPRLAPACHPACRLTDGFNLARLDISSSRERNEGVGLADGAVWWDVLVKMGILTAMVWSANGKGESGANEQQNAGGQSLSSR